MIRNNLSLHVEQHEMYEKYHDGKSVQSAEEN
jgi:hypothetical protein